MQEIIINASATAAKEVIFATFDTSGSAAAATSISVGDLSWRTPNANFATAAGSVSLIGGTNIYHYLPTQAEVSVPGRAILTMSKTGYQRVYEMIDIRGPLVDSSPLYSEATVSATSSRIPFRVYDSYTRLPASALTFTSAEVWISQNLVTYATAGGSVTALGNGDYAYIVTTADVSNTFTNVLQIRKDGYYSGGAIFNVYTSLNSTENVLNVNVLSVASTAQEAIADTLLNRRIKPGASGTRTVSEALAFLRNRVSRTTTAYSVYDVDDTSVLYSGSVTTSASMSPVTEMNPV